MNEETGIVEILGTEEKNEADVQAISALIKAQRELGATVSENLNSRQYTWEDGRLTSIDWEYDKLKGEISFSGLTALKKLNCGRNGLVNIDVSNNLELEEIRCGSNEIATLDLSKNTKLCSLYCEYAQLKELDLSKNTELVNVSLNNVIVEVR